MQPGAKRREPRARRKRWRLPSHHLARDERARREEKRAWSRGGRGRPVARVAERSARWSRQKHGDFFIRPPSAIAMNDQTVQCHAESPCQSVFAALASELPALPKREARCQTCRKALFHPRPSRSKMPLSKESPSWPGVVTIVNPGGEMSAVGWCSPLKAIAATLGTISPRYHPIPAAAASPAESRVRSGSGRIHDPGGCGACVALACVPRFQSS